MSDHVRGEGPRTLLVYGDYECPHTRAAYRAVQRLEQQGVAFRFVFRHFPLTEIHPHALQAAVAAEVAAGHGRFWPMHDLLFERQQALGRDDLVAYAQQVGVDVGAFAAALAGDPPLDAIEEDVRAGIATGVHGTPALFVDGERQAGHDAEDLRAALMA